MNEENIGNVENHSNVGQQTIINIQNMTGNIGLPDKKVNVISTVNIDQFDHQVNYLDEIIKGIVDKLGTDRIRQSSFEDWQAFYSALQNIVRLGMAQSATTGESKTFINNITSLYNDWQEIMIRSRENLPVDNVVCVFDKIVKEIDTYVFYRSVIERSAEHVKIRIKPNFDSYLKKVKEKYSMIKTILYRDQPKEFYSFYICNDIECPISIYKKTGTSFKPYKKTRNTDVISNVTFKKLSKCSRFVILTGTGGLGKSMMMRHLLLNAVENYQESQIIPLFIHLKDFNEVDESLFKWVFLKFKCLCSDITEDQFEDMLRRGSCLLLFDGLDEISTSNANRFEQELEELTAKFSENYFVISSRPHQDFISYSGFTVVKLKPFSKMQALTMIDNLEYKPHKSMVKIKFRTELDNNLSISHSAFIENPLLLSIMLFAFKQYADVPSQMHLLYREAFNVLSEKFKSNKYVGNRTLETGLTTEEFANYFAEICFRTYYDEKFELSEIEFSKYYHELKEHKKNNNKKPLASDYLYDLCLNVCLMYFENGKYHFIHRSFQEYFCALYFSKQKDEFISKIGDFFEMRSSRMFGDQTFNMLCDLIPEKVEEFIFIPFLERLFRKCDEEDGYHTFLKGMYPSIDYQIGDMTDFSYNSQQSFLYDYLLKTFNVYGSETYSFDDLPPHDDFLEDKFAYLEDEDYDGELFSFYDMSEEYMREYGMPEPVGWRYVLDITTILNEPEEYKQLLKVIDDDGFIYKLEYNKAREYLGSLKEKHKSSYKLLLDLL